MAIALSKSAAVGTLGLLLPAAGGAGGGGESDDFVGGPSVDACYGSEGGAEPKRSLSALAGVNLPTDYGGVTGAGGASGFMYCL